MHHLLRLAAILAAATAGCGDPAVPTVDAPVDASVDLALPTIYFRSATFDIASKPLPGVTVSVVDHPEIAPVVSDEAGSFAIPVPTNQVVLLELDRDTYPQTVTRPLTIGSTDFLIPALRLVSTAALNSTLGIVGLTEAPNTGFVTMGVVDPNGKPLSGATASITAAGSKVLYFSSGYFPDPSLTQTSSSGVVTFGNCAPGTATLTVTHPMYPHCVAEGPDRPSPVTLEFFADKQVAFGAVFCGP